MCQGARLARVVHDARGAPVDVTFVGRFGRTLGKVVFQSDAMGRLTRLQGYGDIGAFDTLATWLQPIEPAVRWLMRQLRNTEARVLLARQREWRTLARTWVWGPLWFETRTRYDACDHPIEERNLAAGAGETVKTWAYDAHGRVIDRRVVDNHGRLLECTTYSYDSDEQGNWVRRRMTSPALQDATEDISDMTERAIRYAQAVR